MANKEEPYKTAMYIDLVHFLMEALLENESNKQESSKYILNSWSSRNKEIVKKSLESQATLILSKNKNLLNQKDEISILLSVQELIFNSVREDLLKVLTKGVSESFETSSQ